MKIALLGYGKMGKAIEQLALAKAHQIILKVDENNAHDFSIDDLVNADVAIEFSVPSASVQNILRCFDTNVPIVVGTTGWLDKWEEVKRICEEKNQALFYTSNYSIGVNIFFEINKKLAQLMSEQHGYEVSIEEIHHTEKLDAPSGTAITLANDILKEMERKTKWINTIKSQLKTSNSKIKKDDLLITSIREANIAGTHTIQYESAVDCIEIKHTAYNRQGFAAGALCAAEWLIGKKGVFGMQDLLKL